MINDRRRKSSTYRSCDVLESHDAIPDKKVLEEIVNENWETISANIAELVECVREPQ